MPIDKENRLWPKGEPRFGHQTKDNSSARQLDNLPNPGDKKEEVPRSGAGSSFERAGVSTEPTKRIPGSVYKLEDPPPKSEK